MENVFHNIKPSSSFSAKVIIIFIISILLGISTGFVLAKFNTVSSLSGKSAKGSGNLTVGAIYGSGDSSTFKDMAEGILQKGGVGNEGQFHLVRPGGVSQYVYLTSSLIDLNQFINHKVKVFGQTQKAKVAGWLMDVGKLEVDQ